MSDTTTLPGEGETRTQVRVRRECDLCDKPATLKYDFLLPNYRNNPASNAYGRDDCSFQADAHAFSCEEHSGELRFRDGYEWAGTIRITPRTAHFFLTWTVAL